MSPAGNTGVVGPERPQAKPPVAAASKPGQAKPPVPPAKPSQPSKPQPNIVSIIAPPPKASAGKVAQPKPALTAKEALAAKAKAAQAKAAGKPAGTQEAGEAKAAELDQADVNAGWDTAVAAANKAGDNAGTLVEAWLSAANAVAIVAVAEAESVSAVARKAARRATNILKSRGVTLPEKPSAQAAASAKKAVLEGTFLPPDGSGTSALSITSRDASGRYHLAEVIVREPVGILNAASAWLSGSQLKEGRNRALEGLGVAPAPVPVEWVRYRVANARKLNASSGQVLPLGLEGCRELLEPVPEAEPTHPVADLEDGLTSELAWAVAPGSAALHDEPEFRSWLPDRASLEDLLQRLGQRLGPDGVRNGELVNAALREEMEAATDRFFSPEARSIVASRMRDAAISVRARKGAARATDVLAVALAVREAGLITSPPRQIPFLLGFFQKGISVLAHQGGGSLRIPVGAPQAAPPAEPAQ